MKPQDLVNRTINLLSCSICALAGIAFLPETFLEPEIPFKIDDIILFLIGVGAVIWYRQGKNKYSRSIAPVLLVVASLAVKIFGVIMEIHDKEDVGDDFGGLILFVTATVLVIYLFKTAKTFSQKF